MGLNVVFVNLWESRLYGSQRLVSSLPDGKASRIWHHPDQPNRTVQYLHFTTLAWERSRTKTSAPRTRKCPRAWF